MVCDHTPLMDLNLGITPSRSMVDTTVAHDSQNSQDHFGMSSIAIPRNQQTFPQDIAMRPSMPTPPTELILPGNPVKPSPWAAPAEPQVRPRPFDADIPNSRNVFIARQPSPPSTKTTSWQESQSTVQAWLTESQRASGNDWGQIPENPQSVAASDSHKYGTAAVEAEIPVDVLSVAVPTKVDAITVDGRSETTVKSMPTKKKAISSQETPVVLLPKRNLPEESSTAVDVDGTKPMIEPQASLANSKAAWVSEDDTKAKSSTTPISLREIQELELKRQETKKLVEKDKERAMKSQGSTEATFTASWGLPTSQAGSRLNSVLTKETSSAVTTPTNSSPVPPVWTNAVKPTAKKSMKEIQEEEERRKKAQAKEKETVATTVKRAYGDTTAKVGS